MTTYTTGEIAKLCSVSVRTVQYYDKRGILKPNELSEGGRRLYHEDALHRLKVICFLRELDLPIDSIGALLAEDDVDRVISTLLEEQARSLQSEIAEKQLKLDQLSALKKAIDATDNFSIESIGDLAHSIRGKRRMRKLHGMLLAAGIPLNILEWSSILIWIFSGVWWPFLLYLGIAFPAMLWILRLYFRKVAYVCPHCHAVFVPPLKEALFARHTSTARKLTCTACGHHGFCIETAAEQSNEPAI